MASGIFYLVSLIRLHVHVYVLKIPHKTWPFYQLLFLSMLGLAVLMVQA